MNGTVVNGTVVGRVPVMSTVVKGPVAKAAR